MYTRTNEKFLKHLELTYKIDQIMKNFSKASRMGRNNIFFVAISNKSIESAEGLCIKYKMIIRSALLSAANIFLPKS